MASKDPIFSFYDIESLRNVFTLANFHEWENVLEIFYLVDDPALIGDVAQFKKDAAALIRAKNKNFTGKIIFYDLAESNSNSVLFAEFGLSDAKYINNPEAQSSYPSWMRITCDTDPDYDDSKDPYFMGYNSANYDTTMYILYASEVLSVNNGVLNFSKTTAETMRNHNNNLFSDYFKGKGKHMYDYLAMKKTGLTSYSEKDYSDPRWTMRKNLLMTGRHLDVANLNEKQRYVGLKRLLGYLGLQILESDKLKPGQDTIENYEQLLELIAYNVSDVVNLCELSHHKVYHSSFVLKKQLLKTYPEIVYQQNNITDPQNPDYYKPCISPKTVRRDRLTIDSSSSDFATKALCPYQHLKDMPVVSFLYPAKEKAEELGIEQINVLDAAKDFFYENFQQPEIRAEFDKIYDYYKTVEGKNFNSSKNYMEDYGNPDGTLPQELIPHNIKAMPAPNTFVFYYDKDGKPTSCIVNFSVGGIHGQEYNKELYDYHCKVYEKELKKWEKDKAEFDKTYQQKLDDYNYVLKTFAKPEDLVAAQTITLPDGRIERASTFTGIKKPAWKKPPAPFKVKKPEKPQLILMKKDKDSNEIKYSLNKTYVYTSADPTNHEDFTSYYPNLLRMLMAFFNKYLGYDRYGEVFYQKQDYGKKMKDESLPQEERDLYSVQREGTKLILNSASGKADATFDNNIIMNNTIISMRIIGQLFTWRIGQAQTIGGAKITSTNTDGLYSVLEATLNNMLLEKESKNINVEIEPEPTYLISKDSNNRLEMNTESGKIESASGGTLSCHKGPNPTKSLDHPAIIDWALCEYLILAALGYKDLSLSKPFDRTIGMSILKSARQKFNDDTHTLIMFQNLLAASTSGISFVFDQIQKKSLQHYNRAFYVNDNTPGSTKLALATIAKLQPATINKRLAAGESPQQHDPVALDVLRTNGINVHSLFQTEEASVKKIKGIEPDWELLIINDDLRFLSQEEKDKIFDSLCYERYLDTLDATFTKNWRNIIPDDDMWKALETEEETPDVTNEAETNPFEESEPEKEAEKTETKEPEEPEIEEPETKETEEPVVIPDTVEEAEQMFHIGCDISLKDVKETKEFLLNTGTITKDNLDETFNGITKRLLNISSDFFAPDDFSAYNELQAEAEWEERDYDENDEED